MPAACALAAADRHSQSRVTVVSSHHGPFQPRLTILAAELGRRGIAVVCETLCLEAVNRGLNTMFSGDLQSFGDN